MRQVGILLSLAVLCRAAEDPTKILEQIRSGVAAQLAKAANYACVETIERTYYISRHLLSASCQANSPLAEKTEIATDRLRLDIAVSDGAELFSWHGENHFSSKNVSEIVETGPISSGGFIGYLNNVFLGGGIQFTYQGQSSSNGMQTYNFNYKVPRPASGYNILTSNGRVVVPFHGSFSASVASLEIVALTVVADDIPFGSNICSAETEVKYQLAQISGRAALIPESYRLSMDDDTHLFTISRGAYSSCHEFLAESSLRFDYADAGASSAARQPPPREQLPPGLILRIKLATPIDDQSSYAGDPVDGVLENAIKVPGTNEVIPRGAKLHGVITQFQKRLDPGAHFFVKIVFERVTDGERSYLLRALHKPTGNEADRLFYLYGGILPKPLDEQVKNGTMIIPGKHLRLDQKFKGDWQTVAEPPPSQSLSGQ